MWEDGDFLLNLGKNMSRFSSFKMILELVKENLGISFVYDVIAESEPDIAKFYLPGDDIVREFNFVYLKNTQANKKIQLFLANYKGDCDP